MSLSNDGNTYDRVGRVLPAKNYTTTDPDQVVKLRISAGEGIASMDPMSIPDLLNQTVRSLPNHHAMVYKNTQRIWTHITYKEYRERVHKMAKVFIKLGLEPRHGVSILAFNSSEWFVSNLAAIHAGGITVGIYITNLAEAVRHVLENSRSNIVIVDTATQMEKIYAIRSKLPHLKAVIQTVGPYAPYVKAEDGYYRWSELESMNTDDVEQEFKQRLVNIAINQCCSMVYTSGTVGNPKGAMISHDTLIVSSSSFLKRLSQVRYGEEVFVSFLPLSHVAPQLMDIYLSLQVAGTVYFADSDAMKGTLVSTLREAKPTRLFAVPRVYEKLQDKMVAFDAESGFAGKIISSWAKNVALQHHLSAMAGKPSNSWQYRFVRYFLLTKVKDASGLSRCQTLLTGAAPTHPEMKKFFMSVDLPLSENYGMSETSGPHAVATLDGYNFETIGKSLEGFETRIDKPDGAGNGELCMRGRHVMMGYIGDEIKTKDAIDEDGWMHSGDVAYMDDQGFIYITGRIKEIIITSGGENIPPVHVENLVKHELPQISNAFLVGDRRKFLTMLITLKTQMNVDTGEPKHELASGTLSWCQGLGLEYTKLSQIIAAGPCPKVLQAIQEGIDRANKKAISNPQRVQKFALLPTDFSMPGGELGPTLKVKRNVVVDKYLDIIETFYA